MSRPLKLAFLTSHPIQYQVPLFLKLAKRLDLTVYYCSRLGLDGAADPGFGVAVAWDRPLLSGYRHFFLRNYSPLSSPLSFFSFINPGIVREIRQNRYDAILVHGYSNATSWLAFLAAGSRVPIILHGETVLHGQARNGLKQVALSRLFKNVSAFLAIGTRSREFYQAFGVPERTIFFSPYSVDNDFFIGESARLKARKKELQKSIGIDNDKPVILFASKLIDRKRPWDALKAVEALSGGVNLVIVGDGALRAPMESYVRNKKLSGITFAGFQNQTELPRYYTAADIFLFPSSFETWGLVVNEAMCFGLPIVTTTAVSASVDLVKDGENGLLYEAGDFPALTEHLRSLAAFPKRREAMGKASLARISTWNYEKVVKGIESALAFVSKDV